MVLLNVKQMLKDKGKTKYWLFHQLDCISYTNFNNMIEQKTNSIKYENIEKLCIKMSYFIFVVFLHFTVFEKHLSII